MRRTRPVSLRTAVLITALLAPAAVPAARAAAPPPLLGNPVQYVIVTSAALAPSFAPLTDWKIRKGVPAAVVTLEAIQADYPVAADDAERVRLFLKDAWAAGARYALIGGDTGVIPIRYARTLFYSADPLPTDLYYACLDGSWNADGDGFWGEGFESAANPGDNADLTPELAVGRFPARNALEADRMVQRTIQYERFPAGDYEESRLYGASVLFPQNWTPGQAISLDGAEFAESLLPMHAAHAQRVVRLYENLAGGWAPGALLETRAAVRDSMSRGYGFVSLIGGGGGSTITAGSEDLTIQDVLGLTNAARPFPAWLLGGGSCHPDSESLAEELMRAPVGGAVGCIAESHYSFPTGERPYFDSFQHTVHDSGEIRFGRALNRARVPYVPFSQFDGVNRWLQMTLHLLGDPNLAIWTRRPLAMNVVHTATLSPGQELQVVVTDANGPVAGARVILYQPGHVLLDLITAEDGHAYGTPVGAVDGQLPVTASADNHRPSETVVNFGTVTAAAASLVSADVTPTRALLTWYAADWSAAATSLERRDAAGGLWSAPGRIESSGRGQLLGTDESVAPGARYFYRIVQRSNGETTASPEVAIDIPMRITSALALESVAPHPAGPGARVRFSLAGEKSSRLEVFDLAGRARWTRALDGLGAGRHEIALDGLTQLRPGLYLLRLTEGGVSRSRRIVIR